MNKFILSIFITLSVYTMSYAQNQEVTAIKTTIKAFAKGGDNSNARETAQYLDPNYRVVMNRLFGSKEVVILSREVYLEKIRNKEFGGTPRTLTFQDVITNGSTACAKVKMASANLTFISLINLVKDEQGEWKLVSDTPVVE
ncbi:MAG: nuclear transport factor 2 family protein [Owenweeksia sp.]